MRWMVYPERVVVEASSAREAARAFAAERFVPGAVGPVAVKPADAQGDGEIQAFQVYRRLGRTRVVVRKDNPWWLWDVDVGFDEA